MIEDTLVGVTAGKRGRFGLVLGVDHGGQDELLREHGAEMVFPDLCRLHVEEAEDDGNASIPDPLDDPGQIFEQLEGKRPVLFLDFGETLAAVREQTGTARLSPEMQRILRDTASVMRLVVVSGRDIEEVREAVGLPDICYAGSHGLEILGPDLHLVLPEGLDSIDELDGAAQALDKVLAGIEGAWIERKRFAIAVHFGQVSSQDKGALERAVAEVRADFPQLQITGGKEVIELLPDIDWNKGRAVDWLLSELGLDGPDTLPIYVGDDVTDEDPFLTVRGRGIGILVAKEPRPSAASYRVGGTEQVAVLLQHLTDSLSRRSQV